jgi:hypothetical protein
MHHIATELAKYGRNGDTELVHLTKRELAGIETIGGTLKTNPHTGLKEASQSIWDTIIPAIAGVVGGIYGGPLGSAAASGLTTYAMTGNLGEGVASGLMSYGFGSLAGGLESAGANAAADSASSQAFNSAANQSALDAYGNAMTSATGGEVAGGAAPAAAYGTAGWTSDAMASGAGNYAGPGLTDAAGNSVAATAGPAGSQTSSGLLGTAQTKLGNLAAGASDPQNWINTISAHPVGTVGDILVGGAGLLAGQQQANQSTASSSVPNSTVPTPTLSGPLQRPASQAPNNYYAIGGPEYNYFPQGNSLTQYHRGGGIRHLAVGGQSTGQTIYPGQYTASALQGMSSPAQNLAAQQAAGIPQDQLYEAQMGGMRSPQITAALRNQLYGSNSGILTPTTMAGGGQVGSQQDIANNVIAEAKAALAGEGRDPDQAIDRFVQMFGKDALEQLKGPAYGPGGRIQGYGDGTSDLIPGSIDGNEPVQLADGEFVVPADVVSHLGNGSNDAGTRQLHAMMDRVRQAKTGKSKQPRDVDARQYLPA